MRGLLIAGAAALTLGGCATIVRGTSEPVQFISDPPGAVVTTSLGPGCQAPCSIEIKRSDAFTAYFTLEGYAPQQIAVGTGVKGGGTAGLAGNILFGGLIGVGVDVASGASLDHFPNPVFARMEPLARPAPAPAPRRGRARPTS